MEEIWRDIPGYEGLYEVSSYGSVRNLVTGKLIKSSLKKDGYSRVCLSKNGLRKCMNIHRLVAQAFIPNPDCFPQVNHKDENKANNRVDNLEWCTSKYNVNYGSAQKRRINTNIKIGVYTGLSKKEYSKMYRLKNKEYLSKYNKDYYQKYKNNKKI